MKFRVFTVFAAVLALALAAPTLAQAQTELWSGIIASSRAIDWSPAGVPGGIPIRTTICASIAPEGTAGSPVAPTDINNAIANCPAGQVVYLEAGSYYLSSGIDFAGHNDVTLRGAGADQTILHFIGNIGNDILVTSAATGNWAGNPSNTANWTGGFTAGTTQITLSNTANIIPGKTVLVLDQPDDTSTDTGWIWVCAVGAVCSNESNSTSNGRIGRDQFQLVLATAVNGNTVTISPGIYMPNWVASKTGSAMEDLGWPNGTTTSFSHTVANTPVLPGSVTVYLDASDGSAIETYTDNGNGAISGSGLSSGSVDYSSGAVSAQFSSAPASGDSLSVSYNFTGDAGAWWASSGDATGDGIENLTADNSQNTSGGSMIFSLSQAYGSWISGVRGIDSGRDQVQLGLAAHCTVQNSYFYGSASSQDMSYGIEEYSGSDNLIQNNVLQRMPVGVVLSGGDEGTVVGYNYVHDCFYGSGGANSGGGAYAYMTQCFGTHETGTALALWEGNVGNGLDFDNIHGPHDLETAFRNRLYGNDPVEDYGNNTVALAITPYSRFMNVIGNVIGTSGTTTTAEESYPGGSDNVKGVGMLIGWGVGWSATDPLAGNTSLLWGNYIVPTDTVNWTATALPSLLTGVLNQLANLITPSQTLPPSLYLSAKPAFWTTPWGTPPWPAIGPDVTGGPGPTGHHYPIPAELCFTNTATDSAYGSAGVLLFNAARCYGQPPAAPSGLTATVVQ